MMKGESNFLSVIAIFWWSCRIFLLLLLFSSNALADRFFIEQIEKLPPLLVEAKAGDTIVVKNGIYENIGVLEITASGTDDQKIVFFAETKGEVVFVGKSAFLMKGDHWHIEGFGFYEVRSEPEEYIMPFKLEGASHNRITNCFFLDSGKDVMGLPLIQLVEGSNDNLIDHNILENFISQGIQVRVREYQSLSAMRNTIAYNYFVNVPRVQRNGGESIQVGQYPGKYGHVVTNTIIEHNHFDHADGDHEIISVKSSGCIIRYNQFNDCKKGGIWIRGGNNSEVYGNFMKGNYEGITVFGANHKIYNNYIEGGMYGIMVRFGTDWDSDTLAHEGQSFKVMTNSIVAHNTIVNTVRRGFHYGIYKNADVNGAASIFAPKNNIIANNLIVGKEGRLFINDVDSLTTYYGNILQNTDTAKLGDMGEGFEVADAKLMDKDGMYRPQKKSKVRNRAIQIPELLVVDDLDGQPRSGKLDVGADEFSTSKKLRAFPIESSRSWYEKKKIILRERPKTDN